MRPSRATWLLAELVFAFLASADGPRLAAASPIQGELLAPWWIERVNFTNSSLHWLEILVNSTNTTNGSYPVWSMLPNNGINYTNAVFVLREKLEKDGITRFNANVSNPLFDWPPLRIWPGPYKHIPAWQVDANKCPNYTVDNLASLYEGCDGYIDIRRLVIKLLRINETDTRELLEEKCAKAKDVKIEDQTDCPAHLETYRTFSDFDRSKNMSTGTVMLMSRIQSCCNDESKCRRAKVNFTVSHDEGDVYWPQKYAQCNVQQVCSMCEYNSTSGTGKQFKIVQANNPEFLPYTCSQACADGCAVIMHRFAIVAEVMKFVPGMYPARYWGLWLATAFLGLLYLGIVGASWVYFKKGRRIVTRSNSPLLPARPSTPDSPGDQKGWTQTQEAAMLAAAVALSFLTFANGVLMFSAAGLSDSSKLLDGEEIVTRVLGGDWTLPVRITAIAEVCAALVWTTFLAVDHTLVARNRHTMQSSAATDQGIFAARTLTTERVVSSFALCAGTTMLLLITPAKYDSDKQLCLVYTNMPSWIQGYKANFDFYEQDAIVTDQMVSMWLSLAYGHIIVMLLWALYSAMLIGRKWRRPGTSRLLRRKRSSTNKALYRRGSKLSFSSGFSM